jgi:3-oxoacyl-[acyl-carrier-protein] synthase-3
MTAIVAIGKYEPPDVIDNDRVLDYVRELSANTFDGNIETLCSMLKRLFVKSGTLLRRMPHQSRNYSMMEWMQAAADEAFARAGYPASSVDCVIYCGCVKGFTEPAQAALCAQALGCAEAHAFDVSEACNGWIRALELADFYLKSRAYDRVLILTAIDSSPTGTPGESGYVFRNIKEISYKFGVLTVGCCATATLLERSESDQLNLKVQRIADNALSTCCTISTAYCAKFTVAGSAFNETLQPGQFVTHSAELYEAVRHLTARAKTEFSFNDVGRIMVTHTTSTQVYEEAREAWKLDVELFNLHGETGNLTESSMPLSIYKLISTNRLAPGERITFAGHAAGLSLVMATFNAPARVHAASM